MTHCAQRSWGRLEWRPRPRGRRASLIWVHWPAFVFVNQATHENKDKQNHRGEAKKLQHLTLLCGTSLLQPALANGLQLCGPATIVGAIVSCASRLSSRRMSRSIAEMTWRSSAARSLLPSASARKSARLAACAARQPRKVGPGRVTTMTRRNEGWAESRHAAADVTRRIIQAQRLQLSVASCAPCGWSQYLLRCCLPIRSLGPQ